MRFVSDKAALGKIFLRLLRFSPVSIIPPLHQTNFKLLSPEGQMGEAQEPSKN
jgi:hypothetical protein